MFYLTSRCGEDHRSWSRGGGVGRGKDHGAEQLDFGFRLVLDHVAQELLTDVDESSRGKLMLRLNVVLRLWWLMLLQLLLLMLYGWLLLVVLWLLLMVLRMLLLLVPWRSGRSLSRFAGFT